jgi:hypothetical protein
MQGWPPLSDADLWVKISAGGGKGGGCTTWGVKGKDLFLLHVLRKRMEYPEPKRAVFDAAVFRVMPMPTATLPMIAEQRGDVGRMFSDSAVAAAARDAGVRDSSSRVRYLRIQITPSW